MKKIMIIMLISIVTMYDRNLVAAAKTSDSYRAVSNRRIPEGKASSSTTTSFFKYNKADYLGSQVKGQTSDVSSRPTHKRRVEKEEEKSYSKNYDDLKHFDESVRVMISGIRDLAEATHYKSTILPTTKRVYEGDTKTNVEIDDFFTQIALGNVEQVKNLINKHNRDAYVNKKNSFGYTTLEYALACENPSMEIIDYLLYHHADINKPNNEGNTPMYWAMLNPKINSLFFKALLSRRVNVQNQLFNILRKNSAGNTILIETMNKYESETDDASKKRLAEIFKVLLQANDYCINYGESFNAFLKRHEVLAKIYESCLQKKTKAKKEITEIKEKDQKEVDEVNEKFEPFLLPLMEKLADIISKLEMNFCYDEEVVTKYLRESREKYLKQITPDLLESLIRYKKRHLLEIFLNPDNVNWPLVSRAYHSLAFALTLDENSSYDLEIIKLIIQKGAKIDTIVLKTLLNIASEIQERIDVLTPNEAGINYYLDIASKCAPNSSEEAIALKRVDLERKKNKPEIDSLCNKIEQLAKILIYSDIDMLIEVPIAGGKGAKIRTESFREAINRPQYAIVKRIYDEYCKEKHKAIHQTPEIAALPVDLYNHILKGYL